MKETDTQENTVTYETAIQNLADQGLLSASEVQQALRSNTRPTEGAVYPDQARLAQRLTDNRHVSALDKARGMGIQVGRPTSMASPAQRSYIESLLAQRDLSGTSYEGWTPDWSRATSKAASTVIETLKALPWKETTRVVENTVSVPAGRYAVTGDPIKFYKVDRPTEGKWAGRIFVKVLASDTEYPVRGQAAASVLAAIAADPEAASTLYGREIGACGRCGRTLTDEASRARGIGPDCAQKGW